MLSSGFTGVDVDFRNFEDERDLSLSVMVTTANQPPAVPVPNEALVVLPNHADSDVSAFAEKLSGHLANNGCSILLRRLHETTDLELQDRSSLLLLDVPADKPLPAVSVEDWNALRRIVLSSRDAVYGTRGDTANWENPSANLMSGMARSIRSENPGLGLTTLDVDYDSPTKADGGMINAVYMTFCKACDSKGAERPDWEVAVRDCMPMVQRIVPDKGINDLVADLNAPPPPRGMPFRQEGRPLTMAVGTPDRLVILHFRDDTLAAAAAEPLADNGVEIRVKGVDVVLNSLAGEALRLSWRCIARFGRFVELGQRDIVGNAGLVMAPFLRNVSFHSVNMLDRPARPRRRRGDEDQLLPAGLPGPLPSRVVAPGLRCRVDVLHVEREVTRDQFLGATQCEVQGRRGAGVGCAGKAAEAALTQMITGLGTGGMMALGSEKYPWWFNDAKFAHILQVDTHHRVAQEKKDDGGRLRDELGEGRGRGGGGGAGAEAGAVDDGLGREHRDVAARQQPSRRWRGPS
ncbi:Lovastatin diketide synthase LovF [Colletotrichum tanaceti]|uniref:Lovastatin diketide synthase LovF n=1 Tax=Colletotrichum tanaceti TaxID=1306861 RepID=A0A4U6XD43_9PEZI|nr:Lovastatin diketide synthase LovF [Colletotrichum tanaceti]